MASRRVAAHRCMNQTLCGAIRAAWRLDPDLRILGARHGNRGVLVSDMVDLGALRDADLALLGEPPSAALGTTREKPDAGVTEAALSAFDNWKARAFIYTGGNDTAATLDLLRQHSTGACHLVHAPKTIDNDPMEDDHTPGFISAASVVAHAFTSVDRFLADIEAVDRRPGRCVVSMSDGVQDETGSPFAKAPAKAAGGLVERDARQRATDGGQPRYGNRPRAEGAVPRSQVARRHDGPDGRLQNGRHAGMGAELTVCFRAGSQLQFSTSTRPLAAAFSRRGLGDAVTDRFAPRARGRRPPRCQDNGRCSPACYARAAAGRP